MKTLLSAPTLNSLSNIVVLLQPKYLSKIREFKPTQQNLSNAFYKLIRSSQFFYKPSTKYFLPITLKNGLITASLRYEEKRAEEVLRVKFLPLISSSDTKLIKILFDYAHTVSAGPFALHLNKSATMARMRQGHFGTIVAHVRKIIVPIISS